MRTLKNLLGMRDAARRAERLSTDAARKITGVSTPFGGVQRSDPGASPRELVRRLIVALEDRRAVHSYDCIDHSLRNDVISTVGRIRDACNDTLQHLPEHDFGTGAIRVIRQGCRDYQDAVQARPMRAHEVSLRSTKSAAAALIGLRSVVASQLVLLVEH